MSKKMWEIVLVDDSSEYRNYEMIYSEIKKHKDLPVRYYQNEENLGAAANWNRCIEAARAKWVFMIHMDDLMMENKLPLLLKIIDHYDNRYDFIFLGRKTVNYKQDDNISRLIQSKDDSRRMRIHEYSGIDMLMGTAASAPTGVLIKKETFLNLGGYNDTRKAFALDVELNLRAMRRGCRIACTDRIFIIKREGENDTATSSVEYRVHWINSIIKLFALSKSVPHGGIYNFLLKLRLRDIASWGSVDMSMLNVNFGNYCFLEIALYRIMQIFWKACTFRMDEF